MSRKPPPLPFKPRGAAAVATADPDAAESTVPSPAPGSVFAALAEEPGRLRSVPVDAVDPSPYQARRHFDPDELQRLADSIEENGLLQPPVVRPTDDGRYELIGGERRLRAVKLLGRAKIEVILEQDRDNAAAAVLSLLENTARTDLSAVEEARAFAALIDDFGLTHEMVAKRVGRSRSAVTNYLRLLTLPDEALKLIGDGTLSFAHGRALLYAEEHGVRRELARQAADQGLSTRQLEERAKATTQPPAPPRRKASENAARAALASELAEALSKATGLDYAVQASKKGFVFQVIATDEGEARALANRLATQ